MLKIVDTYGKLDMGQLLQVYSEDLKKNGKSQYAYLDDNLGILEAEQDFYVFCRDFLRSPDCRFCVWMEDGKYLSALRVESYQDGVLITGLETAPEHRRKGYGGKLLRETIAYLSQKQIAKVYSHIRLDNFPSLHLHTQCGFVKLRDSAILLDGSADHKTGTFCLKF